MKSNQKLIRLLKSIVRELANVPNSNRQLDEGPTPEELRLEAEFAEELEEDLTAVYNYVVGNGLASQVGNDRDEVIAWILALFSPSLRVIRNLQQTLYNYSIDAYNIGGDLALEAMGIDGETFDLTNRTILNEIEERTDDLVDTDSDISLIQTTAKDLAIQLEQFDEDDSNNEIVTALGGYILARALTRSVTISQNESVKNSRKAIASTYQRNGIEEKRFRTQGDDRVCPICRPFNGRVYAVDDNSAPEIPDDLHVGCRCYYWPIFPDGWEVPEVIWIGQ